MPNDQANIVLAVIKEELGDLKETPLKLDGIKRALKLGEDIFDRLPHEAVLTVINSGKDRARLTQALATARVAQLESQYNKEHSKSEGKRHIDMVELVDEDLVKLLADSNDSTWEPYGAMVKKGMPEPEAIARWLNDMNSGDSDISENIHPKESAERYRRLVKILRDSELGISSKKMPIAILGFGHSGSLGQVRYEAKGSSADASDVPDFCELHVFDNDGNLLDTNKVNI